MREAVDASRVLQFLKAFGAKARGNVRVYLTGGATSVLHGWRATTIDIDLKIVPEADSLLRAIPELKETLRVNLELAAPDQFIPELPGWEDRSLFITREGSVSFYHYDLNAQALAKLARGHRQDIEDAGEMVRRRLVKIPDLLRFFGEIEPRLYRYPAIDPKAFRQAVEDFAAGAQRVE